jgi:hypothetical protein
MVMKYLRHFPLAVWALVCLVLGGLIAFAQFSEAPSTPNRPPSATPVQERANVMALLNHLATVHAAAAPPASGLAQWGVDTADIAQTLSDRRTAVADDRIAVAYREVAAAAAGLATVDPTNREQVLAGIAALGAAGNRLGAAVNAVELPAAGSSMTLPDSGTTGMNYAPSPLDAPGTSDRGAQQ